MCGHHDDERGAKCLAALARQRLFGDARMGALEMPGQQLTEARARRAAHDDEAPRPQPPMIRGMHGALENQLQRSLIGPGLGERRRGAPRQQGFYGLHESIVADFISVLSVSEACERNKGPILAVLATELADCGS